MIENERKKNKWKKKEKRNETKKEIGFSLLFDSKNQIKRKYNKLKMKSHN